MKIEDNTLPRISIEDFATANDLTLVFEQNQWEAPEAKRIIASFPTITLYAYGEDTYSTMGFGDCKQMAIENLAQSLSTRRGRLADNGPVVRLPYLFVARVY